LDGFLNFLKPPGLTSHDVVEQIRTMFPRLKVGHGGTLDPGAAGVLPILLGKTTRFSPYLVDFPKVYRAELFLGITTDSADCYGKIIARKEPFPLRVEEIEKVLTSFTGIIQQIPPMYAAIKQKGRKLYEYARKGLTVERKPRTVNIFYLKLIDYFPPERILLEVKCSKGTYIRTLCSDIGDALGFGGHMSFLLRTAVGNFTISQAKTFEDFHSPSCSDEAGELLLEPDFPFQNLPRIVLEREYGKILAHGRFLTLKELKSRYGSLIAEPVDENIVPVYTTKGEFMGLARWKIDQKTGFILKAERFLNYM